MHQYCLYSLSARSLIISLIILHSVVQGAGKGQGADGVHITQCQSNFFTIDNLYNGDVDQKACESYQRELIAANKANDTSLCPTMTTVKNCVLALEPRIIQDYANCTQNDYTPDEVCFTKERAAAQAERLLRKKQNILGEVCMDAIVMEAIQLELIAYDVLGCTSYVDLKLSPAEVATNIALYTEKRTFGPATPHYIPCNSPPKENIYPALQPYRNSYPTHAPYSQPLEPQPYPYAPYSYLSNAPHTFGITPYPAAPYPIEGPTAHPPLSLTKDLDSYFEDYVPQPTPSFISQDRYDPYEDPCFESPTPARAGFLYGDPQVPDILETCMKQELYYSLRSFRNDFKYQACRLEIDKLYTAQQYDDESRCPSFELVDECFELVEDWYTTRYQGCALVDEIPGTKCLTIDKYYSILLHSFIEFHEESGISAVCLDVEVYRAFKLKRRILEIAGCTQFTDQIAGEPEGVVP